MALTDDLISQFVKITNDKKDVKEENTVYGTIRIKDGRTFVQLDGANDEEILTPVTEAAKTVDGERVTVMIKNHTAIVTGNLSSPSARSGDVDDLNDTIHEFDSILADKVSTEELDAERARIDNLVADNATIKGLLEANNIDVGKLEADYITVNNALTAVQADVENLNTTKLDTDIATVTYATIESLEATNADIHSLEATYGEFASLAADHFTAINADIDALQTNKLDAETARITYAKIADLNAINAEIDTLQADVANIDTLIFGSATGNMIQASFANAVIAQLSNAQIKSAMIESVSANKITAGDIITNNVRVRSEDGSLIISDETMQISDSSRVRVQIGKDASNDYSINIWDADGNLMFSKGGITDSAIKDAIIRNDMVSDTANIAAHKLDIDSLFEEINGSTNTIKSTQIYLDDQAQTLNVAFKELETEVTNLGETITSQGTQLSVIQGEIESRIWQQDINTATNEMSTKYSVVEQQIDSINTTIASHNSQIASKADGSTVAKVTDRVSSLETNLTGFQSSVSSAYATKAEHSNTQNIATQAFNNTQLQADVTNYAQLNDNTASKWGFTADNTADGHWYTIDTLSRDKFISDWHECVGGERFRISFEISTSCKGSTSNGGTDSEFRGTTIGLYGYDASGKSAGISYSTRVMATEDAPTTTVSSIATIHQNARKFRVFVQTESWGNFSGTIKIRNVRVEKIDKVLENDINVNKTNITQTDTRVSAAVERITDNEIAIVALEATADGLTSRVSAAEVDINNASAVANDAKSNIDNLEIGGRNLFENSGKLNVNSIGRYFAPSTQTYTVTCEDDPSTPSGNCAVCTVGEVTTPITNGGFYLTEVFGKYASKMVEGETYTVSVWVKCSRAIPMGAMTAEFLTDRENISIPNISTEWQRYIIRGKYNGNLTSSVAITFYYNSLLTSNDIFYISSPKIEKGNRATDWTPAPEDMATADDNEIAHATAEAAKESAKNAETLIQQLSDSIAMLVTDGNGTSLMTQTEDGWTFSTAEIQASVNDVSESLNNLTNDLGSTSSAVNVLKQAVTDLGEIAEYVKIGTYDNEPCIELGESDSEFKMRITNTRILFMEGSNVVAHISNQSLHIKKAVIEEELQQGDFVWQIRSNGNLGLIWKG